MEPGFATKGTVPESPWIVCCGGAWGAASAGPAVILTSPSGIKLRYTARL
jgi:ribonuclease HI